LKKFLITLLKFSIPLVLGITLIWFIYKDLTEENKKNILASFAKADYKWLVLSMMLGILSHISRAMRWNILAQSMGYKPKVYNSFFAVMVGYLANMAFPRLGEISRCAVLTKYEKISFDKAFGTVMAERVIDMFILALFAFFTIVLQIDLLKGLLEQYVLFPLSEKLSGAEELAGKLLVFAIIISFVALALYFFRKKISLVFTSLKNMLKGFGEGFRTVLKIDKPFQFILHTVFIWLLYFLMLFVCFFALPETSSIGILAMLSCFVFGSFGIIAVQGGIAYPTIVAATLILYGIPKDIGFAFGWLAWTGQTLMILLTGVFSVISLPLFNKKPKDEKDGNYTLQDNPS
jgi:glycosyltransferase 2 family protein